MTGGGHYPICGCDFAPRRLVALQPAGKNAKSGQSHGEQDRRQRLKATAPFKRVEIALCRFETGGNEPVWNASPWQSAFAAQVLAQGLDLHAADTSALAQYSRV